MFKVSICINSVSTAKSKYFDLAYECEKTKNRGLQPGLRKKRHHAIYGEKTRALISSAVTAQLICAFGFAYADCCFSGVAAHMSHAM